MTEVCPYCRTPISEDEQVTACEGCDTRHHAECYAENGGCTIFGCSCVPPEEPKLIVSAPELVTVAHSVNIASSAQTAVAPPPPPQGSIFPLSQASVEGPRQISSLTLPSILNLFPPETVSLPVYHDPEPVPAGEPKNRTTFIVLGALLGAFGAHNFYAGYYGKAVAQLGITVVTFGFGSPMSWIWAIIDICTIHQDKRGIQFEY